MSKRITHSSPGEWPTTERRKAGWATDWQSTVERDKAAIAESLHDNTGGLLVAAVMDITWAESRLPADGQELKARLVRARAALDAAIALNRRMIEDLRPTLLDNFGLVPALQWHFAEVCKTANIRCDPQLPNPAPHFQPAVSIAFYRIAQTLIAVMLQHQADAIKMTLAVDPDWVSLQLDCSGTSDDFKRDDEATCDALASATGRIQSLGGTMQFDPRPAGALVTFKLAAERALSA